VTCPLEQKILRFAERAAISPEAARDEVQRRMEAQMPEEEKAKLADFVIDNSGSREDAAQQVDKIWRQLRS
jgi:dephospho-CoA kinase